MRRSIVLSLPLCLYSLLFDPAVSNNGVLTGTTSLGKTTFGIAPHRNDLQDNSTYHYDIWHNDTYLDRIATLGIMTIDRMTLSKKNSG